MTTPSIHATDTLHISKDDHVMGSNGALITIVDHCDCECPHCGRASPIIKQLQSQFQDRLRFLFRHLPLIHKHPRAQRAAEGAEAADTQGDFWASTISFLNIRKIWKRMICSPTPRRIELDTERFGRDVATPRCSMRVSRDVESDRWNSVAGTPTFFINGSCHRDEETWEEVILRMMEKGVSTDKEDEPWQPK